MQSFTLLPVLGRKTAVPANDLSLIKPVAEGMAMTHDVGGVNFSLVRKKNTCTKSFGSTQWSNSATAQATKCMGLFELYDGTNRNHIYFDNGKVYIYDNALDPQAVDAAAAVTFANDDLDFYSIVKVGDYMVFADRAEHTPYKWKHGDANLSKLINSGTEFKFRELVVFQRRVLGLYSDQANGNIDIRWSSDWPTTAITSLSFPAANQFYVPNDDPLVGGATMGTDRCYIYSEDSISQIVYYPDYEAPFRIFTVVPQRGAASAGGIVSLGDRHYLFNKNYGFCMYAGGRTFPAGGRPISEDIEADLQNINADYYHLIQGVFVPLNREIVWTVPMNGATACNNLLFYNIDTGAWRIEDKAMRCVDSWRMYDNFTWNDLITELGGTGAVWSTAGTERWAHYLSARERMVFSNTDGHLYYQSGESLSGAALDGYRIEPILDFGDIKRKDLLQEIWIDVGLTGSYDLDFYWRGGDTVGEVEAASWTSLGVISCNSPATPSLRNFSKPARLHQIKWGTDAANEKFEVSKIILKFQPLSEN